MNIFESGSTWSSQDRRLWRILHLDLYLHTHKVQLTQQLKPVEHSERRRYVEWVLEQQAVDDNFLKKSLFGALFNLKV